MSTLSARPWTQERQDAATAGDVQWVSYSWDLSAIPRATIPSDIRVRLALPTELPQILRTVLGAYRSDAAWRPVLPSLERPLLNRVRVTLGAIQTRYVVLEIDRAVAGVSGVAVGHWSNQHFLTGPCLKPSFEDARLGQLLVDLSLRWLKTMGVTQASAVTVVGSFADRCYWKRLFRGRWVAADELAWWRSEASTERLLGADRLVQLFAQISSRLRPNLKPAD